MFMNRELTLEVCGESLKLQLQRGFFDTNALVTPIHSHKYTEIQIVSSGKVRYTVENIELVLEAGQMLATPSGIYHSLAQSEGGAKRVAFQVSKPIEALKRAQLPAGLANSLIAEVERYRKDLRSTRLCAYLSLICTELFSDFEPPFKESADRGFLVDEYFSKNYNDPEASLEKIAKIIGLSKKQTEREIIKITGNNFRTELSLRRIKAAKLLMDKGDKTLAAVAEEVGYRSYSGFWKAFSKFGQ